MLLDGSLEVGSIAIGANGNKTITEEAIFEAEEEDGGSERHRRSGPGRRWYARRG